MNDPFRLGLTGSIGMGKSTTAKMFQDAGVPVWDADQAVHRLYEKGRPGFDAIAALCPDAVRKDKVDRAVLSAWLAESPDRLNVIEAAIHPLVAGDRADFLRTASGPLVVLDIPLLFETGAEKEMDATVVVTTSEEEQERRVLARAGVTRDHLNAIRARQMPDAEKRQFADYVITTTTLEDARRQVHSVIEDVRKKIDARNRA